MAGTFLWLETRPVHHYISETSVLTAAQAVQLYPGVLITGQEFALGARLLADEEVSARLSDAASATTVLDPALAEPEELLIDSRSVQWFEISIQGNSVAVDYLLLLEDGPSPPMRRCILSFTPEGRTQKTMAEYRENEAAKMKILNNLDNEEFSLCTARRDFLAPLRPVGAEQN